MHCSLGYKPLTCIVHMLLRHCGAVDTRSELLVVDAVRSRAWSTTFTVAAVNTALVSLLCGVLHAIRPCLFRKLASQSGSGVVVTATWDGSSTCCFPSTPLHANRVASLLHMPTTHIVCPALHHLLPLSVLQQDEELSTSELSHVLATVLPCQQAVTAVLQPGGNLRLEAWCHRTERVPLLPPKAHERQPDSSYRQAAFCIRWAGRRATFGAQRVWLQCWSRKCSGRFIWEYGM